MLDYQKETSDEVEQTLEALHAQAEYVVADWEFRVALNRRKYGLSERDKIEIKSLQNRKRRKLYNVRVIHKTIDGIKARSRAEYKQLYAGTKPDNKAHLNRALKAYVSIRNVIHAKNGGLSREVAVKILEETRYKPSEPEKTETAYEVEQKRIEKVIKGWKGLVETKEAKKRIKASADSIKANKKWLNAMITQAYATVNLTMSVEPCHFFPDEEPEVRQLVRNRRAFRAQLPWLTLARYLRIRYLNAPPIQAYSENKDLRWLVGSLNNTPFRSRLGSGLKLSEEYQIEYGKAVQKDRRDWNELLGDRPVRRSYVNPVTLEVQHYDAEFKTGYNFSKRVRFSQSITELNQEAQAGRDSEGQKRKRQKCRPHRDQDPKWNGMTVEQIYSELEFE